MTSSWPVVCCREDEPCQQTFSRVSGYCFSSSLFSFMAVIPEKQDGENKRSAQHIYPRSFISTIIALRASYNLSTNKFPSWQISYLLQRAEFSEIPLLLAAALKRLDNILTLQAIQHKGGRELLAGLNWPLASLEGRINKQSWVTLWRHTCNAYHGNDKNTAITQSIIWFLDYSEKKSRKKFKMLISNFKIPSTLIHGWLHVTLAI